MQVNSFAMAVLCLKRLRISIYNINNLFYYDRQQILHCPPEISTSRAKTKPLESEFFISVQKTWTSYINNFFILHICAIVIPASCHQTSHGVLPNVSDCCSLHWIHLQHVLQETNYRWIQVLRGIKDTITYLLKKGWHMIIIKWKRST